jgi:uncharacterized protein YodC (DUF2158 family)
MNPFEVGDVVMLKSGSPRMTVTGFAGAAVECAWFGGATGDDTYEVTIPAEALVFVGDGEEEVI